MTEETKLASSKTNNAGLSKLLSLVDQRAVEKAIWTFTELGVPDIMIEHVKPMSAKEICQADGSSWNPEYLYRLMRVLVDVNIIRTIDEDQTKTIEADCPENLVRFELTDQGQLLTKANPSRMRSFILFNFNPLVSRAWEYLPLMIKHNLKDETNFDRVLGMPFFNYLEQPENKQLAQYFHDCMIAYTNTEIGSIPDTINFDRFEKLIDIGGGLGTLLASILGTTKTLKGVLFDLPRVIERVASNECDEFRLRNIDSNRYEIVSGDMFQSETIPTSDAYIMKHIIHDWNDEKSVEILNAIRSANQAEKGKKITLFIVEKVILTNGKESFDIHVFDLLMMNYIGAKERTVKQYSNLLAKGGFEYKELYETSSTISIIEAVTTI